MVNDIVLRSRAGSSSLEATGAVGLRHGCRFGPKLDASRLGIWKEDVRTMDAWGSYDFQTTLNAFQPSCQASLFCEMGLTGRSRLIFMNFVVGLFVSRKPCAFEVSAKTGCTALSRAVRFHIETENNPNWIQQKKMAWICLNDVWWPRQQLWLDIFGFPLNFEADIWSWSWCDPGERKSGQWNAVFVMICLWYIM